MKTPTTPDIEGPFYIEGAPTRNNLLIPSADVKPLFIQGKVLDTKGYYLSSEIELWHANQHGEYDKKDYKYRGRTHSGGTGNFTFFTIFPGRYIAGSQRRPAHVHFKVVAEGYKPLTTQLYFKNDPYNKADPWYDESRAVVLERKYGMWLMEFEFVLESE